MAVWSLFIEINHIFFDIRSFLKFLVEVEVFLLICISSSLNQCQYYSNNLQSGKVVQSNQVDNHDTSNFSNFCSLLCDGKSHPADFHEFISIYFMKNDKKYWPLTIDYHGYLINEAMHINFIWSLSVVKQVKWVKSKLDTKTVSIFCVFWYLKYSFIISG